MSVVHTFKIQDLLQQLSPKLLPGISTFEDFTVELCTELARPQNKTESREADRIELPPVPAEAQPLDGQFNAAGSPFAVIIRNISASGIGLMFGKPISCDYLMLQVNMPSGRVLKTVIQVMHCTEKGILIGGKTVCLPE